MSIIALGVDTGFTKGNPSALAAIRFDPKPMLLGTFVISPVTFDASWEMRVQAVTQLARLYITNLIELYGGDIRLCSVEMPFLGDKTENAQTSMKLASVVGGIFLAAHPLQVRTVMPSQGKKALSTNGQATKPQMVASAKKLWGVAMTDHEAHACGVAIAGALLEKLVK